MQVNDHVHEIRAAALYLARISDREIGLTDDEIEFIQALRRIPYGILMHLFGHKHLRSTISVLDRLIRGMEQCS